MKACFFETIKKPFLTPKLPAYAARCGENGISFAVCGAMGERRADMV
jgi:hypothetical protein